MALTAAAQAEYDSHKQRFDELKARAEATDNPAEKQNILNLAEQARAAAQQIYDTGQEFAASDALRLAAQGATFGAADEIEAGVRTGFGLAGDYDATRDAIRAQNAAVREAYPGQSMLAEAAGGVAIPGLGAVKALRGASTLPRMLGQSALVGGIEGAAAGYGYSEGESPLLDTLQGAAIGSTLMTALPAAAPLVAWGGRGLKKLARSPLEKAEDYLGRTLRESGADADFVVGRMEELGPEAVMADVGSGALGAAATAQAKGDVASRYVDELVERNRRAPGRLAADVEEAVQMPSGSYLESQQRIRRAQKQANRELYGALEGELVPREEVQDIIATNAGQKAYKQAMRNWQDRNRTDLEPEDMIPLEILDDMKRILGKEGTRAQRGQRSGTEDIFFGLEGDLRDAVDSVVDNYRVARQSHQYASELIDAGEAGRGFFGLSGDAQREAMQEFAGMSTAQQRQFQRGALETTAEKIREGGGMRGLGSPTSRLGSPDVREGRLAPLEREGIIARAIGREDAFGTTAGMLAPQINSRTAIRQEAVARADELSGLGGVMREAAAPDLGVITNVLESVGGMSRAAANELARLVLRPGITRQQVERILARSDLPPDAIETVRRTLNVTAPAAAAGTVLAQ